MFVFVVVVAIGWNNCCLSAPGDDREINTADIMWCVARLATSTQPLLDSISLARNAYHIDSNWIEMNGPNEKEKKNKNYLFNIWWTKHDGEWLKYRSVVEQGPQRGHRIHDTSSLTHRQRFSDLTPQYLYPTRPSFPISFPSVRQSQWLLLLFAGWLFSVIGRPMSNVCYPKETQSRNIHIELVRCRVSCILYLYIICVHNRDFIIYKFVCAWRILMSVYPAAVAAAIAKRSQKQYFSYLFNSILLLLFFP